MRMTTGTKGALNITKLEYKIKELIGGFDWGKRDRYAPKGLKGSSEKDINCGC